MFSYVLPILATVILVVLLTMTLMRLAVIQREMRNNTHANMTWVIYQTHLESVILHRIIESSELGEAWLSQVQFRYQLLLSRLRLLTEGLQFEALQHIGAYQDVITHTQALESFHELLDGKSADDVARHAMVQELDAFHVTLSKLAGRAMAAQWEVSGERLDRYRNGVLLLILLMVGVWVCSVFIAVKLLFSLKRTREIESVKRRELDLSRRLEHERKISELYRSFGAMVSHQFRNPLAVIDASMQRLIRAGSRMDAQEVARRAEKVRAATKRLSDLIDSILHADKSLDHMAANMQRCSLADLAQQSVVEQRALTPLRRISLSHEMDTDVMVRCDPTLTVQILGNFLSNAVKYSDEDTKINVVLRRDGEWVRCQVCDQGRGISSDDLPHIFKRYFRAWDASSVMGTGIGLYIASELTSLQGGVIQVSSELGVGSVFELSLKACDQEDMREDCSIRSGDDQE